MTGLPGVYNIHDYILVIGKDEHMQKLMPIMTDCWICAGVVKKNILLNGLESKFSCKARELLCMGHIFREHWLKANPEKVTAIQKM